VSRNSIFSVITFGFLAIVTTACGGGDAPKPTKSEAPQASAPASPSPATNFNTPTVPGKDAGKEAEKAAAATAEKPATGEVVAGLVPASDAETVVRATAKGRPDPFSNVVLQPIVETKTAKITKTNTAVSPQPGKSPNTPNSSIGAKPIGASNGSNTTSNPSGKTTTASTNGSATTPTKLGNIGSGLGAASAANLAKKNVEMPKNPGKTPATTEKPNSKPNPIAIKPVETPNRPSNSAAPQPKPSEVAVGPMTPPAPKPVPQPDLARSIIVYGVSQVNGQTQVIVKLPNESFSRYVTVGEKLMDGRVLVKRVQGFSSSSPVVILEEVGIEVPRKVGDKTGSGEAKK
jgi:hypothetical protein